MNISRRSDGTVNRHLINLFSIKSSPSETPINGVKSFDITVDSSRNLWFRLYTPAPTTTETSLPIIIYFHGGGFAFMAANSKTYDEFCQKLAREIPSIVVSVNYRLSPEHKYPCQYEDGFDVLKFIDEAKFEEFPQNANMKHCFLAGDSAGANLAHHVALKACDYKFLQLQVIGIISLQPFFGGEERTESETKLVGAPPISVELTDWMWKAFLPEGSDRDHAAANVFGSNSVDISGMKFPATIMFVGGFDPLQDWQKKYYEWLKRSGKEVYLIEYPNAFHTFYLFPELPESSLMIKEVKEFMQKQSCN
uniref:Alpha/beta hydrolase fold-3 domain-containing protein n=1 Tax=Fagus sylvatica TaxID=28930 RepID=A0A2N9EBN0_FAGSY